MNDTRRLAVILALLLLTTPLATISAASTASATASEASSARLTNGANGPAYQQDTPTNGSAVRQENPDEASGGSDRSDLRSWLSDRLTEALVSCARLARPGGNGTCQTLESEYPSLASRYGELAQETEESSDDNVTRVLNRTGENQAEFVRTVQAYRESLSAYRDARQRNDLPRARELARNVSRRGTRAVAVGERLSSDYRVIVDNSTIAADPALEITESVTENVSTTTEEIRTSEFNPAVLTFSSNASAASFAEPVLLQGRLESQNGTALSNRTVAVQTPETTIQTRTTDNGTFAVTYRPSTADVGNATAVAQFVPRNDSQYTGTSVQTPFTVESVTGNLKVNSSTSGVAFGEEMSAQGTLDVNGTGVPGVPVALSFGNVSLGEVRTNESGGFSLTEPLPAAVPNGTPDLTASIAAGGIAVAAEPASTPVPVNETRPSVRVQSERLDADTATVSGSVLVGDLPITGAELELRKDGEVLQTARTDEEGRFGAEIRLPDVPANETTTITVAYDPPGGNLAPVELQLPVSTAPDSNDLAPDIDSPTSSILPAPLNQIDPILLVLGVLLVLVVFLVGTGGAYGSGLRLELAAVREQLEIVGAFVGGDSGEDEADESSAGDYDGIPLEEAPDESGDAGVTLLELAQNRIHSGEMDGAVVAAYSAARHHLDARFGIDATLTHGELLRTYRDRLGDDHGEALERLTSAYERAAFAPSQNTVDSAYDALESADFIVGSGLSTNADNPGDD